MTRFGQGLVFMASLTLGTSAFAQTVPVTLVEQGRLLDASGAPLTTTTELAFAFYKTATGGTPLWSETQGVNPTSGYFSVQLGEVTPFPASLFNGTLYLGIAVNGDPEMTPRQRVGSVPYALVSNNAVGDITPTSVTVGGTPIISSSGAWLGGSTVRAWAWVETTGAVENQGGTSTITVTKVGTGEYCIQTTPDIEGNYTPIFATLQGADLAPGFINANNGWGGACNAYGAEGVFTANSSGAATDRAFMVMIP